MTTRYYEETSCQWGFWHDDETYHDVEGFSFDDLCPGGSRRELEVDEILADIDGIRLGQAGLKVHVQGPALVIPLPEV